MRLPSFQRKLESSFGSCSSFLGSSFQRTLESSFGFGSPFRPAPEWRAQTKYISQNLDPSFRWDDEHKDDEPEEDEQRERTSNNGSGAGLLSNLNS
jgi:hypothetical protein